MPSQVADDLWHEFILFTRAYKEFCHKAFGRFLHRTPAAVLKAGEKEGNTGLRREWWQTCKLEGIDPRPRPGCLCSSRWMRNSISGTAPLHARL